MHYRQGDIVLVPFPFSDLSSSKVRPAIVVSGNTVNNSPDVILAALTTNIRNDNFSFGIKNTQLSSPIRDSEVRCNKLFTCEKRIIHKAISSLDKKSVKYLIEKIKDNFSDK